MANARQLFLTTRRALSTVPSLTPIAAGRTTATLRPSHGAAPFPPFDLVSATAAAAVIARPFTSSSRLLNFRKFKKAGDVEAASMKKQQGRWKPAAKVKQEAPSPESLMTPEELARWIAKRPVDDVWLQKYYPEGVFALDKIVEMNRQANHPTMLDNPDGDVMVELKLNMKGAKLSKPIKAFSALTQLPHLSAHSTIEPRDVAVIVKNTDLQAAMEAKGARYVGGEDLILKLKNGLIQQDSDYDYLIAHMDIVQELGAQLKKKFAHLMPTEKAGTLGVDLHAMFDLHQNGYLLKVKSGHDPTTGSVAFSLGKLSHSVEQMRENLDVIMKILRNRRPAGLTPKRGLFITGATIKCPPNTEVFKWEVDQLNEFMDAVELDSVPEKSSSEDEEEALRGAS